MIANYPEFTPITLEMRPILHPLFQQVPHGVSEYTFANIFLFRDAHQYQVSRLPDDNYIFIGNDNGRTFFFAPFGLPPRDILLELFQRFGETKLTPEQQVPVLEAMGFKVWEDRDNFDYLYSREDLTHLPGPKFHKKKNLINAFIRDHVCTGKPLLDEYLPHAFEILEHWHAGHRTDPCDYKAAREALELNYSLELCGGIYFIDDTPVAYVLGEENTLGQSFLIHFEKAVKLDEFKGLYQFINRSFASILPDKYIHINREQDLGSPGLRQAKDSYHPVGFVKKYRSSL